MAGDGTGVYISVDRAREAAALRERIVAILCRRAPSGSIEGRGSESRSLFRGGLNLDSVAFLEAVLEIESAAGIRLRDENLVGDALASVGQFANHIVELQGSRAPSPKTASGSAGAAEDS